MSFSFWLVNLNGIDGLFSGVSRCYLEVERVSSIAPICRIEVVIVLDVQVGESH
jgi:hypothetical protein